MRQKISYSVIYLSLGIGLLFLFLLSVGVGAVNLSYSQILNYFLNFFGLKSGDGINKIYEGLFLQIRLPRTILCMLSGAILSVCGAMMQSLFRNPIVEPGLIGTSSGAALGASLVFVFGKIAFFSHFAFLGNFLLPFMAFVGGLSATLLVYRISSSFGKVNITSMLLAGIAVNAIAAAGVGFLSYIARDPQARSITFWNLGTYSGADWPSVCILLVITITGIFYSIRMAKALNAFQLGETEAGYLGINTRKLKMRVIVVTALMVSVATAMTGVISFVGLIVPHILRLIKGSDNRYLIIGSALLGAIVTALADMLARIIIAPAEMPVGIITAFVGAPLFLWLLIRNSRKGKGNFYA
ncbi:MAG: iron ABC transporter permease [Bacteroidia bacterium]